MADPLAAIGLAANIAQFVEYGIKLISESKMIYYSARGATEGDVELEIVVKDLQSLSDNVTKAAFQAGPGGESSSADDINVVQDLAIKSKEIANRLLEIIQALRIPEDTRHRKLVSVRMAFRGLRRRPEILELEGRLERIQKQLDSRMAAALCDKQSDIYSAVNDLAKESNRISVETTNKLDELSSQLLLIAKSQTHNPKNTDASFHQFSAVMSAFAAEWKRVEREQKILESLCFREMKERYSDVKEAHANTLKWIYERQDITFMNWLECQNGVYWISGKAGSGKSTLMKFIFNHERTQQALQTWARPAKPIIAGYFFWNAGLLMQKSQEGLLRTLLYQILKQCPVLIPSVCPTRWQTFDSSILEPWTRAELFRVFDQIAKQIALPSRFCFFIDGLDEYNGDEAEIIELMDRLVTCPSVKLCVSSRPWNAFVDKFRGSNNKLAMQDLTKDDMWEYVTSMLAEKALFAHYASTDNRYTSLVSQITDKAQGVWLWVYLVVRSLARGLEGDDEFELLQKRLNEFPADLKQYFSHILGNIENVYREETAQIFLIVVQAVKPLPLIALDFLQKEKINPDYALRNAIEPFPESCIPTMHERWQKRLNNRCKDLLEVNIRSSKTVGILDYRVDFLHRTVRDFLKDKSIQDDLRTETLAQFDPRVSLIRMLIAVLKVLSLPEGFKHEANNIFELVDEVMHYAKEIEMIHSRSEVTLLDELDAVNSMHAKGIQNHWTNARDTPQNTDEPFREHGYNSFLASAIQARLQLYVTEKLDKNLKLVKEKRGRPLLDYALRPKQVTPAPMDYHQAQLDANLEIDMVSTLLYRGADPNQKVYIYGGETVWGLFLLSCYYARRSDENNVPSEVQDSRYKAVALLVKNGADLGIKIGGSSLRQPRTMTVRDLLQSVFPDKIDGLNALLGEKGSWRQGYSAGIFRWIKQINIVSK